MKKLIKKFALVAGLDSQVFATLAFRGWQVAAGGIMLLLIPLWLGRIEQGYYYTFTSLLALQVFFELGMNQVVMQQASHDFAHVDTTDLNQLRGTKKCIERLAGLVEMLRRWYVVASLLFFIMVTIIGAWFFYEKGDLPVNQWGWAWLMLCACTAINLYLSGPITIVEACGGVAGIARMRLVQSIIGHAAILIAIVAGAGLWAILLLPLVCAIYSIWWLSKNAEILNALKCHYYKSGKELHLNWFKDIFPFQWKIALSWISGYFIFQLFTPLAFTNLGAVEAGRLGMSMAVFSAVLTVGMSWVNAKAPEFAACISRNDRTSLNELFNAVIMRSIVFVFSVTVTIIFLVALLTYLNFVAIYRFGTLPVVLCLGLVTLVNCFVFGAATYMRAHKEEPMLIPSVVVGIATLFSASLGSQFGVFPMMALYAGVNVFIALPWTIYLFRKYRKRPDCLVAYK